MNKQSFHILCLIYNVSAVIVRIASSRCKKITKCAWVGKFSYNGDDN